MIRRQFTNDIELIQYFLNELWKLRVMVQRFGKHVFGQDKSISISEFALLYPVYLELYNDLKKLPIKRSFEVVDVFVPKVKLALSKLYGKQLSGKEEEVKRHVEEVVNKIIQERIFSILKPEVSTLMFMKQLSAIESDMNHLGDKKRFLGNLKTRLMGDPKENIQKKFKKHIQPLLDNTKYTISTSGGSVLSDFKNRSISLSKSLSGSIPVISEKDGSISLEYSGRTCSCSCSN